jgi:hypothetical protein
MHISRVPLITGFIVLMQTLTDYPARCKARSSHDIQAQVDLLKEILSWTPQTHPHQMFTVSLSKEENDSLSWAEMIDSVQNNAQSLSDQIFDRDALDFYLAEEYHDFAQNKGWIGDLLINARSAYEQRRHRVLN